MKYGLLRKCAWILEQANQKSNKRWNTKVLHKLLEYERLVGDSRVITNTALPK